MHRASDTEWGDRFVSLACPAFPSPFLDADWWNVRCVCVYLPDTTLYFGCRSLAKDYLFQSDWERMVADGHLTLRVAASRDQVRPSSIVVLICACDRKADITAVPNSVLPGGQDLRPTSPSRRCCLRLRQNLQSGRTRLHLWVGPSSTFSCPHPCLENAELTLCVS